MSSKIEKQLSAVRCVKQGPAAVIQTIELLDAELIGIKTSLMESSGIVLGERISAMSPLGGLTLDQFLYVQYAYTTAALSVHSVLAYPWMRAFIGIRYPTQYRDAIERSVNAVTKCSREAILLTEHIQFSARTTVP